MNKQQAIKVGTTRQLLLRRLKDALYVLSPEARKQFGKWHFDFINQRLVGENGLYLQWLVRPKPDESVSYDNQQTNRGSVRLRRF